MSSRPATSSTRTLARLVVAGVVVVGTPLAIAGTAEAASDSVWDRVAQCESGGNWSTSTGNGFAGGLQFTPSTWRAYGGSGSPAGASRSQQIAVAERVLAAQGWGAWPTCSKKAGASGSAQPRASAPQRTVRASAPATKKAERVVATARVVKNGGDYTVAAGDTLSRIASRQDVAGGWKAVWNRNADVLSSPDVLRVGQQLDLR